MQLQPANLPDLLRLLADANARGAKVESVSWDALDRVIEHTPEDMIVTVEAGLTLAALQAHLARRGQWLPVDPPQAERLTIGALLATNVSGPRRFGFGTIREHLIGLRVALADGRIVQSGGKVVKNVAGYDLLKLFVGSHGSLGVIVEATFKLRPQPEAEAVVQVRCESLAQAGALREAVLAAPVTPVVLDLHGPGTHPAGALTLTLGFAGTREEVAWQVAQAQALGVTEGANLDYETSFWAEPSTAPARQVSVLPSRLAETLQRLGEVPFVARAGNGLIYYRGGPAPPSSPAPLVLAQRLKAAFDPRHLFPPLPL